MTIRQLLSHRSGVHEPQEDEEPSHLDTLTDRDIVKIIGAKPLDFEPGTSARYSNFGYVLLGMILEKATGASIGQCSTRASSIAREWMTVRWHPRSGMFADMPMART